MDQYLDNRHKEIFWKLLSNPADNGQAYLSTLQRLVNENSQSGILQVMYARAAGSPNYQAAAAYFNPQTLFKLVNNPNGLAEVDAAKIITRKNANSGVVAENTVVAEPLAEALPGVTAEPSEFNFEPQTEEQQVMLQVDDAPLLPAEQFKEDEQVEESQTEEDHREENQPEEIQTNHNPTYTVPAEESDSVSDQPETIVVPAETETEEDKAEEVLVENWFAIDELPEEEEGIGSDSDTPIEEYQWHDIDEEVYDEIVGIDEIGIVEPTPAAIAAQPEQTPEIETVTPDEPAAPKNDVLNDAETRKEEEKLIIGGIVGGDYLAFDKRIDELRSQPGPAADSEVVQAQPVAEVAVAAEKQDVSKYDDDKMPYSFMWWLDKTRKEHASASQPYAANPAFQQPVQNVEQTQAKPVQRGVSDNLQHQYYENIFSTTSVNNIEAEPDAAKIEFDHNKKEDVIIERFITTDPQIRPPAADKLDTENKAKKSSEDQDVMVTETLARIYADQMLYHKAIATYKKLQLKFPEKKLYFAAQIEQLEKKTN
ncbi:hypothetical protein FPZ43_05965 [Mucilaginibacter pallidiroseus]|uniref:Uncharacterized protein n=1 Tax=Mucilaginibacter pallidiroseus TaxID=2599295 RepID=A0A563UGK1_9SPHI|nr:hypothetical protein [Mucilaginibacter pallidiroseus]TWR30484.1 hypothetical protein FPZ43_05965 [Mucilaginibacter pallidiroseus]